MSESWPAPLETLTILAAALRRRSGSIAWVRRQAPNMFVSIVLVRVVERRVRHVRRDFPHHPGVVDQDVEAPGLGVEPLAEPLDALRVGDVELLGLQREAPALGELLSGALGGGGVARGDDHVMSEPPPAAAPPRARCLDSSR